MIGLEINKSSIRLGLMKRTRLASLDAIFRAVIS